MKRSMLPMISPICLPRPETHLPQARAARSENDAERKAAGFDHGRSSRGEKTSNPGFLATPAAWLPEVVGREPLGPGLPGGVPLSKGRRPGPLGKFSAGGGGVLGQAVGRPVMQVLSAHCITDDTLAC